MHDNPGENRPRANAASRVRAAMGVAVAFSRITAWLSGGPRRFPGELRPDLMVLRGAGFRAARLGCAASHARLRPPSPCAWLDGSRKVSRAGSTSIVPVNATARRRLRSTQGRAFARKGAGAVDVAIVKCGRRGEREVGAAAIDIPLDHATSSKPVSIDARGRTACPPKILTVARSASESRPSCTSDVDADGHSDRVAERGRTSLARRRGTAVPLASLASQRADSADKGLWRYSKSSALFAASRGGHGCAPHHIASLRGERATKLRDSCRARVTAKRARCPRKQTDLRRRAAACKARSRPHRTGVADGDEETGWPRSAAMRAKRSPSHRVR